ncbi:MAG: winged helix-turn-helix transcriptional regulator [Acidobacteria bacterium]|nr:winged helix-turn-helix transcriptional regulator [Acidobacteriota bacterium]
MGALCHREYAPRTVGSQPVKRCNLKNRNSLPVSEQPSIHVSDTEKRLLAGLAKIALVLRRQGWIEAGESGITPTQAQILALLWSRQSTGIGVSALAAELALTKATVSDSVSALVRKGLVQKEASAQDARAVNLRLTYKGEQAAAGSALWPETLLGTMAQLTPQEQACLLRGLVKIIRGLHEQGMIPAARMCVSCQFFQPNAYANSAQPHRCELVNASFGDRFLQIDCGYHALAPKPRQAEAWSTFVQMV